MLKADKEVALLFSCRGLSEFEIGHSEVCKKGVLEKLKFANPSNVSYFK